MLGVIVMLYMLTQIMTRTIMALLGLLPAPERPKYGAFVRLLMILNSGINLFVYIG